MPDQKKKFVLRGHDPYTFGSYYVRAYDTFEKASAARKRYAERQPDVSFSIEMVDADSDYKQSTEMSDKEKYGE